jgi:hypothetical protein
VLGPVDRLARLESLLQVGDLGLEGGGLGEPAHRHLDGGCEVGLGEGLDQVGHRPGVARPLDQLALGEGRQHHHRCDPLAGDPLRRGDPVEHRHLDVEDDQVGTQLLGELDGLLAVTGLAHHVVPLVGQHLGEVHADQRLVLGDHDTHGAHRLLAHPVRLSGPRRPTAQAVMAGRSRRAASSSTYSSISMRSSRARLHTTAAARAFSCATLFLARPHPLTAPHGVHMTKSVRRHSTIRKPWDA